MPGTPPQKLATGVPGLDDVLAGGLPRGRLYLVEGDPGTGKTTLGLQFLLEGVRRKEKALYVTLTETADELRAVAQSHGWSLASWSAIACARSMTAWRHWMPRAPTSRT
jgi:circadian clock protein KaiC